MSPLPILHLVSTLARTGPTNQLYQLLAHLDPAEFLPVVATLSPEPADSRWADFAAAGCEVRSLGLSRPGSALRGGSALKGLLREVAPALIHSHGWRADLLVGGLPAGGAARVPRLSTVHNVPLADYGFRYGAVQARLMLAVQLRAWRRFDAVVGVSRAVAEVLKARHDLERVHAVLNGVEAGAFRVLDGDAKRALRGRLGLPVHERLWVFAGHLSPLKNVLALVKSWRRQRPPGATLVLLGDGPQRGACEAAAAGDSAILLPGRVTNVADFLAAADYYVSLSLAEGFPIAVLEALASGLPAVLSPIPPHRELAARVPEAVVLASRADGDTLEHAIDTLCTLDYAAASHAARRAVDGSLSAADMARGYAAIYRELAGHPPVQGR